MSGAGRKTEISLLFSEASDNFAAYNVTGHRHRPETRESLAQVAKRDIGLVFNAHLAPMNRGIFATLYGRIVKEADFQKVFEKRYQAEPFVDVLPAGSHPDTRSVRAANTCRIAVHRPPEGARSGTLTVSVIDNLVKAPGQAVQNMNDVRLPETAGLSHMRSCLVRDVSGRSGSGSASASPRRALRPLAHSVVLALAVGAVFIGIAAARGLDLRRGARRRLRPQPGGAGLAAVKAELSAAQSELDRLRNTGNAAEPRPIERTAQRKLASDPHARQENARVREGSPPSACCRRTRTATSPSTASR
jgi:hypothetical protein